MEGERERGAHGWLEKDLVLVRKRKLAPRSEGNNSVLFISTSSLLDTYHTGRYLEGAR